MPGHMTLNGWSESRFRNAHRSRRSRLGAVLLACSLGGIAVPGVPALLTAQGVDTTAAKVHLFTRNDAYLGAAFIAGTVALRPLDKSIAGRLQNPST